MRKKILLHNRRPKNTIPVFDGTLKVSYYDGRIRFTPTEFTDHRHPKYDKTAKCPEWDKTLRFIFGLSEDPKEMVRHFEEILGWLVCPSQLIDCNVILFDEGNTIATKVIQAIGEIVKDRRRVNDFVITTDAPLSAATIRRYDIPLIMPFDRNANLIGLDPFTWDRIIADELPGVFNRCLEGLTRLIRRREFDFPPQCKRILSEWIGESVMKTVAKFAEKHLVKTGNEKDRAMGLLIYKMYKKWDTKNYTITTETLYAKLEMLGYEKKVISSRLRFIGVSIVK